MRACVGLSFYPSLACFREVMVPSLHWFLLLWGLQGLWAQDYDEDSREQVVTTRKRSKVYSSNFIPQNAKGKSKVALFF